SRRLTTHTLFPYPTLFRSAANEQGFSIRSWGDTSRIVERWEGLFLVRRLPRLNQDVLMQAPTAMRLWAKRDPFQPLPCHLVDTGDRKSTRLNSSHVKSSYA